MEEFRTATRLAADSTTITVLEPEGAMDIHSVYGFDATIQRLFSEQKFKLIVNMGKLTEISSAGFGILINNIITARKMGGDIVISNVKPNIQKTFDLLELSDMFRVFKTEENAAKFFSADPRR
jgi:anti-sigma B factor antagonist